MIFHNASKFPRGLLAYSSLSMQLVTEHNKRIRRRIVVI
jgi:hypothetical protein